MRLLPFGRRAPWLNIAPGILMIATACTSVQRDAGFDPPGAGVDGPRVLCVIAHPDDEAAFAGTLYKIATHLGGTCDILVITNGEAGYKYSTLAESVYRKRLTDPSIGRDELPRIRQREMRAAADVLGVREVWFLSEWDNHYTQDPAEILGPDAAVWNLARVRSELARRLRDGNYEFVFTHLPTEGTHGHHKAATILALEAVAAMPLELRPVALGSYHEKKEGEKREIPYELAGYPITRQYDDRGPWTFDRTQTFGYQDKLDYRIVTSWAVAEHKSQGTYQSLLGKGELEAFRRFAIEAPHADGRTQRLFERLAEPQFPTLSYDEDGQLVEAH